MRLIAFLSLIALSSSGSLQIRLPFEHEITIQEMETLNVSIEFGNDYYMFPINERQISLLEKLRRQNTKTCTRSGVFVDVIWIKSGKTFVPVEFIGRCKSSTLTIQEKNKVLKNFLSINSLRPVAELTKGFYCQDFYGRKYPSLYTANTCRFEQITYLRDDYLNKSQPNDDRGPFLILSTTFSHYDLYGLLEFYSTVSDNMENAFSAKKQFEYFDCEMKDFCLSHTESQTTSNGVEFLYGTRCCCSTPETCAARNNFLHEAQICPNYQLNYKIVDSIMSIDPYEFSFYKPIKQIQKDRNGCYAFMTIVRGDNGTDYFTIDFMRRCPRRARFTFDTENKSDCVRLMIFDREPQEYYNDTQFCCRFLFNDHYPDMKYSSRSIYWTVALYDKIFENFRDVTNVKKASKWLLDEYARCYFEQRNDYTECFFYYNLYLHKLYRITEPYYLIYPSNVTLKIREKSSLPPSENQPVCVLVDGSFMNTNGDYLSDYLSMYLCYCSNKNASYCDKKMYDELKKFPAHNNTYVNKNIAIYLPFCLNDSSMEFDKTRLKNFHRSSYCYERMDRYNDMRKVYGYYHFYETDAPIILSNCDSPRKSCTYTEEHGYFCCMPAIYLRKDEPPKYPNIGNMVMEFKQKFAFRDPNHLINVRPFELKCENSSEPPIGIHKSFEDVFCYFIISFRDKRRTNSTQQIESQGVYDPIHHDTSVTNVTTREVCNVEAWSILEHINGCACRLLDKIFDSSNKRLVCCCFWSLAQKMQEFLLRHSKGAVLDIFG